MTVSPPAPRPVRRPALAARPDGPHHLRCANVACGRRLPGVWVVPLEGHSGPVLVFDRAWWPAVGHREHLLRLRPRAQRRRDFVTGRVPFSDYAGGGSPRWRRPNWIAWREPRPLLCPHCGTPLEPPPNGICDGCLVGGEHDRDLHAALLTVLESEHLNE